MTTPQQPENPYAATGGQPPTPPAYPQPGYPQPPAPAGQYPPPGGYPAPGMPQAPAYQQGADPGYAAYAAGGYGGYAMPQLASWGQRVGAYLIDMLPTVVLIVPAAIVAASTATTGYNIYGDEVSNMSGTGVAAMLIGYGLALCWQVWNRWIRQGGTGQSLGKSAMHLRLVAEQTMQPIGAGKAFLRDVCHIADGIFYLGYLWPLWDPKRQTFADKIMTTVVVEG